MLAEACGIYMSLGDLLETTTVGSDGNNKFMQCSSTTTDITSLSKYFYELNRFS